MIKNHFQFAFLCYFNYLSMSSILEGILQNGKYLYIFLYLTHIFLQVGSGIGKYLLIVIC